MITRNISCAIGLVNGTIATVIDLYYSDDESDWPSFIILESDSYRGISLIPGRKVFPLLPTTEKIWCKHEEKLISVTSYNLKPAAAWTVNKTQSQTMSRIVIHMNDFNGNYDARCYTSLSRVKSLDSIIIETDNSLDYYFPTV
ncbi:unnamed protein product [Orchesella dallaii]|uniref:Uncharacterized protein n=1 Tax=Orchesella dallaii TaxID=48710 RepID=A0ABP1R3Y4_9HEXA